MARDDHNAEQFIRLLVCGSSLEGGGSERQLWQLLCKLDRQRFRPDLFLLYRRGVYLDRLPHDLRITAFDDQQPDPRPYWPGRISHMQVAALRTAAREFSSEIVYDRTYHSTLLTAAAFPPGSIPRVSVIVSPPSRDFERSEKRFRHVKRWLLRRAYRSAASVIAVSRETADDAAEYYRLDRSRIHVFSNPVDMEAVERGATEVLSSPLAGNRIAVIGRMTAEKGHATALRVLAQLLSLPNASEFNASSLELDFIGDGPLRSELESQADTLGIRSRVHFHGYQTNPYPYMRQAACVYIPSSYEGFPNVALETLALGTPLVMNDYGGSARYVIGENNVRGSLVSAGDERAAAEAIARVLMKSPAVASAATAGRLWVREQHGIEAWLKEMQEHFTDLVRKQRRDR